MYAPPHFTYPHYHYYAGERTRGRACCNPNPNPNQVRAPVAARVVEVVLVELAALGRRVAGWG